MILLVIQLITLATRASLGAGKRCNSPKDDQAMTTKTKAPSEAQLLEIAAKHFHLETLETRNRRARTVLVTREVAASQ
jgi:hypothetical protein